MEEKKKDGKEEMKKKYGVMKEIPERSVGDETQLEIRAPAEPRETEEISGAKLILRLERIDGKLEMFEEYKRGIDERLTHLAEGIGEIRSALLERERSFSKTETEFEKILDVVSGLEPEKIKKELEKKDAEMLEMRASIEKLGSLVKEVQKQTKELLGNIEAIKGVENLVEISKNVAEKLAKVDKIKASTVKVATKVDTIFSELSEKLNELEGQKEKINKIDELTIDIVRMLDDLSVKLSKFVDKSELERFKKEVSKKIGEIPEEKIEPRKYPKERVESFTERMMKLKERPKEPRSIEKSMIEIPTERIEEPREYTEEPSFASRLETSTERTFEPEEQLEAEGDEWKKLKKKWGEKTGSI